MLRLFIALALIYDCSAAITDKTCTTPDDKYDESAINCENVIPDDMCKILMKTDQVKVGTDTDRAGSCVAGNDDEKKALTLTCPKTCGYCCLSEAYQCEDSDKPSIDCSKVTSDMCKSDIWKPVLAKDCPKKCGLCKEHSSDSNCKDAAPGCDKDKSICNNVNMQDFVKKNCQKTCDLCDDTSTSSPDASSAATDSSSTPELSTPVASTTTIPCVDDPRCASWVNNGFCNSVYSQEMKRQFCGKSCNLC